MVDFAHIGSALIFLSESIFKESSGEGSSDCDLPATKNKKTAN